MDERGPVAAGDRAATAPVPWNGRDTAVVVAGSFLGGIVATIAIAWLIGDNLARSGGAGMLFVTVAAAAPGVMLVERVCVRRRGAPWRSIVGPRVGPGTIATMALLASGVLYTNVVIAHLLDPLLPDVDPAIPGMRAHDDLLELLWLLVAFAVVVPIAEELVFRGVLYRYARSRWGVRNGILLSATVFALVHVDPVSMVGAFLVGIAAALFFQRDDSLYPAIGVHVSYNALVFLSPYALALVAELLT